MRKVTSKMIELAEEGVLPWEAIARECLAYMSESDVADMATGAGFIDEDDDEEDTDETGEPDEE